MEKVKVHLKITNDIDDKVIKRDYILYKDDIKTAFIDFLSNYGEFISDMEYVEDIEWEIL